MKGIILFDIDRTLFDTEKMLKLQREEISELLGTSLKQLQEIQDAYYESLDGEENYDLDEYSEFVGKALGISGVIINEVLWSKRIFRRAVFVETEPVILELHSRGYTLGIYSEGPKKFQRAKYNAMKMHQYFKREYVFINEDKRSASYIKKLPDEAIIVDDNIDVIQILNSHEKNFETYCINRVNTEEIPAIRTIHSLKDLREILK